MSPTRTKEHKGKGKAEAQAQHARSYTWVRDKNGSTFLCPKQELLDPKKLSDSEIKKYCIDESTTPPWND